MDKCPCGSDSTYEECCGPIISGEKDAMTAEALMRSRYTAYVKTEVDFILNTTHPDQKEQLDKKSIHDWSKNSEWLNLELVETDRGGAEDNEGQVEFIAHYRKKGIKNEHHELAQFEKKDGKWYFTDGQAPKTRQVVRSGPKVGRNDPCPCGSGKKYKKCCAV